MKKELKMIIQELAEIQIQAFLLLEKDPGYLTDKELQDLFRISHNSKELYEAIQKRINFWLSVKAEPEILRELYSEYQWGICVHILFTMEEEWVQTNPDGVIALWELLDDIYAKFHPEIRLFTWLQQNKFARSYQKS